MVKMLTVTDLVGGYSRVPVLKGVSFTVQAGELVGLIGLNGAGKSTTLNHIIGLMQPFSGRITVDGVALADQPEKYKQALAYIPETPVLYEELTLREHLAVTIQAYGLAEQLAWKRAHRLLQRFRLDNKLDWFPVDFSKGMRQKVMIVAALMTDAKLYVIDEPFYGLDPLAVRDFLELIDEKKRAGAAVLMSTHVLANAERYCDRFVLLNVGQVRAAGTLAELTAAGAGKTLDEVYFNLANEAARG